MREGINTYTKLTNHGISVYCEEEESKKLYRRIRRDSLISIHLVVTTPSYHFVCNRKK
jgi:hypothetical protein